MLYNAIQCYTMLYTAMQCYTNTATKNVRMKLNERESVCFEQLKKMTKNAVELSHPDPNAEFCLFTDASETGWEAVLFQIQDYDPKLPYEQQHCEPIYFLGGMFRGSALNWPIIEKEAFAIMESVDRLDYLLQRPRGFRILCDHRNLIYIFSENAEHKKATSQKLERWSMRLCGYNYIIEHISGEDNKWADLLSRWAQPSQTITLNRFHCHPLLHPLTDDFTWPTIQEITAAQQATPPSATRTDLVQRDGVWFQTQSQALWIPEEADELITRLMITAHFGTAGHRGTNATRQVLKKYCYWRHQPTVVQAFCKQCLHCLHTRGGKIEPKPLGTQLHATRPTF